MAYKKYYDRNKEKILANERAAYKLRVQQYANEHKCRHCGGILADDYKLRNCRRCLDNRKRYIDKVTQPLKDAAYMAYGGYVCACCGETEPIFLTIDHINNNGNEHRKTISAGYAMYLWLKKNNYPEDFQILCMNCNWGKARNKGVCPHKNIKVKIA